MSTIAAATCTGTALTNILLYKYIAILIIYMYPSHHGPGSQTLESQRDEMMDSQQHEQQQHALVSPASVTTEFVDSIHVPPGRMFEGTHYILRNAMNTSNSDGISQQDQDVANNSNEARNVVIVHGIGSYYAHFEDFSKFLCSEGYRVLTYDLIGRGFSEQHEYGDYDGNVHIDQLRNLIKELRFHESKYHIIGHSMGGALAALYTDSFYEEIASMTVLSPAGLMDPGVIRLLRRSCSCLQNLVKSFQGSMKNQEHIWRADFHSHSNMEFENAFVESNKQFLLAHPEMFESIWACILQFPLYGLEDVVVRIAENTAVPVLVLWGSHDVTVPTAANLSRWKCAFDKGRKENPKTVEYRVYENAGHGFYLEKPKEVFADTLQFLKKYSS